LIDATRIASKCLCVDLYVDNLLRKALSQINAIDVHSWPLKLLIDATRIASKCVCVDLYVDNLLRRALSQINAIDVHSWPLELQS